MNRLARRAPTGSACSSPGLLYSCCLSSAQTGKVCSSPPSQIDKEGANPERVKQELTEHNLIPGGFGISHFWMLFPPSAGCLAGHCTVVGGWGGLCQGGMVTTVPWLGQMVVQWLAFSPAMADRPTRSPSIPCAEEWGGKTPMVAISAKKGQGVDGLLETVRCWPEIKCNCSCRSADATGLVMVMVAEMEEPPANPCPLLVHSPVVWRPFNPCNSSIQSMQLQVLLVAELEELQANPARTARGTVLVRFCLQALLGTPGMRCLGAMPGKRRCSGFSGGYRLGIPWMQ